MASNTTFGHYYLGTLLRPRRTFDLLLQDPRRLKFGALALAINALLYTLVYVFLTMGGGAPSSLTPWLNIPADVYYAYNRFILAPSMFGCWILAAGVAQLLSRLFSGEGTFEDTLSTTGLRHRHRLAVRAAPRPAGTRSSARSACSTNAGTRPR